MRSRFPAVLTAAQSRVIVEYATAHGRYWKADLRESWANGCYYEADDSASLQQLRNTFGPAWLVRFRLPVVSHV